MKQIEELPSRDVVAIALFQVCCDLALQRFLKVDESDREAFEAYIKGLIEGYLNRAIEQCDGMSETEISGLINQQLSVKDLTQDD